MLPKNLSEKALEIHKEKLYQGYVKKSEEISGELRKFALGEKTLDTANQTYSELRGLKEGETFAKNGKNLHEWYFEILDGDGQTKGELADELTKLFGSVESFKKYFKANGLVARGWAVLCWDIKDQGLRIYIGDAHNHGGVWGVIPLIVLDVYEHAYFMDYGSDRGAYIDDFFTSLNWEKANESYLKAKQINL